jgi:hypothetical protein
VATRAPDGKDRVRIGSSRLLSVAAVSMVVGDALAGGGRADVPTDASHLRFEVDARRLLVAPDGVVRVTVAAWFDHGHAPGGARFWVRGLPRGFSADYTPQPLDHQGMAILTISGDGSAAPGSSRLRLGARAGGAVRIRPLTLVVTRAPQLSLQMSPATGRVSIGEEAGFVVTVDAMNGFDGAIALEANGLPPEIQASFEPVRSRGSGTATLSVVAGPGTEPGRYEVSVSAEHGGATTSATLVVVRAPATWHIASVGSTGLANNSVRVGRPRNVGRARLYVGTLRSARVVEFSWNGSRWRRTSTPLPGLSGEIHNLTIGAGRNDGVQRIYACQVNGTSGNLWEVTWLPGQGRWASRRVGSAGDCKHAEVGEGRNDGVERVYAARGPEIREYTWDRAGQRWVGRLVGSLPTGIAHGLVLGRGRGGPTNHVYIASTETGSHEATYSGGGWVMRRMGDGGDVRNMWVGTGRHDGVQRVYGAIADPASRGIREFTWNGGGWTIRRIASPTGLIHAEVARGRNDGVDRIYAAGIDGRAFEFTRSGGQWVRRTMGSARSYLYGLHFGRTRGSTLRVYGASFDTNAYELTWR